jgi:hypothetical protein
LPQLDPQPQSYVLVRKVKIRIKLSRKCLVADIARQHACCHKCAANISVQILVFLKGLQRRPQRKVPARVILRAKCSKCVKNSEFGLPP